MRVGKTYLDASIKSTLASASEAVSQIGSMRLKSAMNNNSGAIFDPLGKYKVLTSLENKYFGEGTTATLNNGNAQFNSTEQILKFAHPVKPYKGIDVQIAVPGLKCGKVINTVTDSNVLSIYSPSNPIKVGDVLNLLSSKDGKTYSATVTESVEKFDSNVFVNKDVTPGYNNAIVMAPEIYHPVENNSGDNKLDVELTNGTLLMKYIDASGNYIVALPKNSQNVQRIFLPVATIIDFTVLNDDLLVLSSDDRPNLVDGLNIFINIFKMTDSIGLKWSLHDKVGIPALSGVYNNGVGRGIISTNNIDKVGIVIQKKSSDLLTVGLGPYPMIYVESDLSFRNWTGIDGTSAYDLISGGAARNTAGYFSGMHISANGACSILWTEYTTSGGYRDYIGISNTSSKTWQFTYLSVGSVSKSQANALFHKRFGINSQSFMSIIGNGSSISIGIFSESGNVIRPSSTIPQVNNLHFVGITEDDSGNLTLYVNDANKLYKVLSKDGGMSFGSLIEVMALNSAFSSNYRNAKIFTASRKSQTPLVLHKKDNSNITAGITAAVLDGTLTYHKSYDVKLNSKVSVSANDSVLNSSLIKVVIGDKVSDPEVTLTSYTLENGISMLNYRASLSSPVTKDISIVGKNISVSAMSISYDQTDVNSTPDKVIEIIDETQFTFIDDISATALGLFSSEDFEHFLLNLPDKSIFNLTQFPQEWVPIPGGVLHGVKFDKYAIHVNYDTLLNGNAVHCRGIYKSGGLSNFTGWDVDNPNTRYVTSSCTLTEEDVGATIIVNSTSTIIITVPTIDVMNKKGTCGKDAKIKFYKYGAGNFYLYPGTGVNLISPGGKKTVTSPYAELIHTGIGVSNNKDANAWFINGQLV